MFFSAFESRKRERSPPSDAFSAPYNSPAVALGMTSPTVDVLAKRQRMGNKSLVGVLEHLATQEPIQRQDQSQQLRVENETGHPHGYDREETSKQYAEKRRAKQWEQLNAPGATLPFMTPPCLPDPKGYVRSSSDASLLDGDLGYFASPATHQRGSQQQGRPQLKHHMSSSPIRHQPPGSSPFKSSGPSSQNTIRDDFRRSGGPRMGDEEDMEDDDDEDDAMDQEELRRDWGEHYARPNELLLSLHRSRQSQQRIPPVTPHLQPQDRRPYHGLSSPFIRPSSSRSHSFRGHEAMDGTQPSIDGDIDPNAEVERQYEETNRLLGELELVRRQRFNTE